MRNEANNESEESRRRWDFIERASREVDDWPEWKKAEVRLKSEHSTQTGERTKEFSVGGIDLS
jgi:hypothetical protein